MAIATVHDGREGQKAAGAVFTVPPGTKESGAGTEKAVVVQSLNDGGPGTFGSVITCRRQQWERVVKVNNSGTG